MMGKILAVILGLSALVAGGAMYYLQVYGFYEDVQSQPGQDVVLMPLDGGEPQAIAYGDFQAIDAGSSPIRYRACFQTELDLETLSVTYVAAQGATPRNGPGWFGCYDAAEIGAALEAGDARAYLGVKNVSYGVDRIVAITKDGRGYIWHDLNHCGEKAYDGTVVGEDCPPRPENE